jgi:putative molybdopterin biosynthesis protein
LSRKIFRELVSVEEAMKKLGEYFQPKATGVERTPLKASCGRVLGEDIVAPIDVPPFDRASMDGYAVHADDTYRADEEHPIELRLVGSVEAGTKPEMTVQTGQAAEVSTGAPMPKGANAVVMVEYTSLDGDLLKVFRSVSPGENIMAAGTDIMAGELVLRTGTLLTPRETGVLAALGLSEVDVFGKPKVAVISTGNELVTPGEPLSFGMIYDINAQTISDSVRECGGKSVFIGIIGDRIEEIRDKLAEAVELADVVVVSGGTSVGVGDLLYRVIDDLGSPGILVHGVAVKPGKPTIIAVADGRPIFSLPGYPTSALMIFSLFVAPIIRSMAGLRRELEAATVIAKTSARIFTSGGRREYVPVNLVKTREDDYRVYSVPGGSGAITTLAKADGFIEIPKNRTFLEEDETVAVRLFGSQIKPVDLMFIGSHCLGVDLILKLLREKDPSITYKVINVGSSGGLSAIRRGEADLAGVHLLDEVTGEYNLSFLERFGIRDKAVLFKGYIRKQGLIVAKGNPKGIKGFKDFLREDVDFINRNKGSGTRILLDKGLKEIAGEMRKRFEDLADMVDGYNVEAKSHSAVAASVAMGKADVGVGIKVAAEMSGLDFVPVADEEYDFAVNGERLGKRAVRLFLETLRSREFREKMRREMPGLEATDQTGSEVDLAKGFKRSAESA